MEAKGKKLENVEQVRKCSKIGDIVLRKVIPVVEEEKVEAVVEGDGEVKAEDD